MANPDKTRLSGPTLLPVDFSPTSAAALLPADRLRRCLKVPLRVLHVAHYPESAPGYEVRSKAVTRILEVAGRIGTGMSVEKRKGD